MSIDIACKDKDSAATSTGISNPEIEKRLAEAAHVPAGVSQEQFLCREAERTKAALVQSLDELKTKLRVSADVRLWAKDHPLAAVAVAAAGGFAAASVLTPSRDESLEEKWSRLAESVHSAAPPAAAAGSSAQATATPNAGLTGVVVGSLIDMARVALEKFIAASTQARAQDAAALQAASAQEIADDGREWQG